MSTALERLFKRSKNNQSWWYLESGKLKCYSANNLRLFPQVELAEQLVQAHYRYANEFIWPVMHELPQYAVYNTADHFLYNRFNQIMSSQIIQHRNTAAYFIQDYQLSLLPKSFKSAGLTTGVFWHIPWPKHIPEEFLPAVNEIAESLLAANVIGFHTQEYARNFHNFAQTYLCKALTTEIQTRHLHLVGQSLPTRYSAKETSEIIAAPLGLDYQHWSSLNTHRQDKLFHPGLRLPFFLSVDRADYTKGITNRLHAVDHFFTNHPELKEKVCFVQICTPSRTGIAAYDKYWQDCQNMISHVTAKYATESWQPIITIKNHISDSDLALLYCNASVMIVNPIKDGLNLTAKEFVACQRPNRAGVLALSRGAGVFEEFGKYVVAIDPREPQTMAEMIYSGLTMHQRDKELRIALLNDSLRRNSLDKWSETFAQKLNQPKQSNLQLANLRLNH